MKMEQKVDRILETVIRMEGHVERNTDDIAEHIRRTELIEGRMDKAESWMDKWKGALKLVSIISVICAALGGVYAIINTVGG